MIDIEEVFGWLRRNNPSNLDTPATTLILQVIGNVQSGNNTQAYQIIEYLDAIADELSNELRKPVDAGDIWSEIGLAFYQMGNIFEAERFWMKAVQSYPAESHEHAVVRWLVGAVQWSIETKNKDAVRNWKGAIREFRNLAEEAERQNRIGDKDWYEEKKVEMENSLEEALSRKFP